MSDLEIADRYTAFWNATTPEDQQRLARLTFVDAVEYHAPIGVLVGAPAMIGFRDEFTSRVPTARLVARRVPERHHDRVRFQWEIVVDDDESFATGTDVIELTDDGRISSVTSFLDRAPEGFDAAHH